MRANYFSISSVKSKSKQHFPTDAKGKNRASETAVAKKELTPIKLPKKFIKYFWDCDFESLKWEKYSFFITERILNFGDVASVHWLLDVAGRRLIVVVAKKSRSLDEKTKNFWLTVYGK